MSQKNRPLSEKLLPGFTVPRALRIVAGAAIVSFGLYNVHQRSGITEGGVLGTVLLLHHWFGWPASVITPVLDISCYLLALKVLGPNFIKWSVASTLCVSGFFRLWETWPPFLPDLSGQPLLAAVLLCAEGPGSIEDVIFERRFGCAAGFAALGGRVRVEGRTLCAEPGGTLQGTVLEAPDLRGGAALVIAALAAQGSSRITHTEFIDRGYADFAQKLTALGGQIARETPRGADCPKKRTSKT